VERCEHLGTRALLDRVCDLYALSTIEAERGWYQEHGKLSSPRSKAVIKAVNTLCAELRPHATELVEAFGVPETSLGDADAVARASAAPAAA
jgi:acyl-CoA oxidase